MTATASNNIPILLLVLLIFIFLEWKIMLEFIDIRKFSNLYWICILGIDKISFDLSVLCAAINLALCLKVYAAIETQRRQSTAMKNRMKKSGRFLSDFFIKCLTSKSKFRFEYEIPKLYKLSFLTFLS